jgi:hypothetical protein
LLNTKALEIEIEDSGNDFCRMTAELTAEFENFVKNDFKLMRNKEDGSSTQKYVDVQMFENVEKDQNVTVIVLKEDKNSSPAPDDLREETPDFIPLTVREKFHVLRIEESFEQERNPDSAKNVVQQNLHPIISTSKCDTKLESGVFEERQKKKLEDPIMFHDDIEVSMLKKKEPPVPPIRSRRSAKDIIESINRSQQLLKLNASFTPKFESKFLCDKPAVSSKSNVLFKLYQQQSESEHQLEALLSDLQNFKGEKHE